MTTAAMDTGSSALLGVYRPAGPVFVSGEGCWLVSEEGDRYLDFTSGIAVNALGYGDPAVADAIRAALDSGVIHTSNLFRTRPAGELAEWLVERSFADRVFFCNSGAEANEGALKFARRWARAEGHDDRTDVVAFRGSFHGRTMGALARPTARPTRSPSSRCMPGVRTSARWATCRGGALHPRRARGGGDRGADPGRGRRASGAPAPSSGARLLVRRADALLSSTSAGGAGADGTLWAHERPA
jgi:4-aminobutyrate aminotransferase-like enzyme